jgi:hypothetical protein
MFFFPWPCTTSRRDESGALPEKDRGGQPDISMATKNKFGNKRAAVVVAIRMSWGSVPATFAER